MKHYVLSHHCAQVQVKVLMIVVSCLAVRSATFEVANASCCGRGFRNWSQKKPFVPTTDNGGTSCCHNSATHLLLNNTYLYGLNKLHSLSDQALRSIHYNLSF